MKERENNETKKQVRKMQMNNPVITGIWSENLPKYFKCRWIASQPESGMTIRVSRRNIYRKVNLDLRLSRSELLEDRILPANAPGFDKDNNEENGWVLDHKDLVDKCLKDLFESSQPSQKPFLFLNETTVMICTSELMLWIRKEKKVGNVEIISLELSSAKVSEAWIKTDQMLNDFVLPEGYSRNCDFSTTEEKDSISLTVVCSNCDGNYQSSSISLLSDRLHDILPMNYARKSRVSIEKLVTVLKEDKFLGKIGIIHGPAGTGKTHLLKSILRDLRNQYSLVVVTNPLRFFFHNHYYHMRDDRHQERYLFVFEDSDNLLSSEARDLHPDEFSNLLNITSGLVGSGMNDIFLFTFNREIGRIDDAITRECRSVANIEIGNLDEDAARKFVAHHLPGISEKDAEDTVRSLTGKSLAEAYSTVLDSRSVNAVKMKTKIGF